MPAHAATHIALAFYGNAPKPQLCTSYLLATSPPVEMFRMKLNPQVVDLIELS
jgi:hypothetical protein